MQMFAKPRVSFTSDPESVDAPADSNTLVKLIHKEVLDVKFDGDDFILFFEAGAYLRLKWQGTEDYDTGWLQYGDFLPVEF